MAKVTVTVMKEGKYDHCTLRDIAGLSDGKFWMEGNALMTTIEVDLPELIKCQSCNGQGGWGPESDLITSVCSACRGTGEVTADA